MIPLYKLQEDEDLSSEEQTMLAVLMGADDATVDEKREAIGVLKSKLFFVHSPNYQTMQKILDAFDFKRARQLQGPAGEAKKLMNDFLGNGLGMKAWKRFVGWHKRDASAAPTVTLRQGKTKPNLAGCKPERVPNIVMPRRTEPCEELYVSLQKLIGLVFDVGGAPIDAGENVNNSLGTKSKDACNFQKMVEKLGAAAVAAEDVFKKPTDRTLQKALADAQLAVIAQFCTPMGLDKEHHWRSFPLVEWVKAEYGAEYDLQPDPSESDETKREVKAAKELFERLQKRFAEEKRKEDDGRRGRRSGWRTWRSSSASWPVCACPCRAATTRSKTWPF